MGRPGESGGHVVSGTPGPVRLGIVGVGALTLRALLPHLCEKDLEGVLRLTNELLALCRSSQSITGAQPVPRAAVKTLM